MSIDLPEAAVSIDAFSKNIASLCLVIENLEKIPDNDHAKKTSEAAFQQTSALTKNAIILQIMIIEAINKQPNLVDNYSEQLTDVFDAIGRLETALLRANELVTKRNKKLSVAQKAPDDIATKIAQYRRSAGYSD